MSPHFDEIMDPSVLNEYEEKVELTTGEDYTHALLFNTAMPVLGIPKSRVVGFAHEPTPFFYRMFDLSLFVPYCQRFVGRYYVGDLHTLPSPPFQEGQQFLGYNRPSSIPAEIRKTKFCSIILSGKKMLPGHRYRHELVEAILNTDLPIDMYGRGCEEYKMRYPNDGRIKGAFPETAEATHGTLPYLDYRYSICIENSLSHHYFSEKIINPLLYGTTPLYIGCENIEQYLPKMAIRITGRVSEDVALLCKLQGQGQRQDIDLKLVLRRVNLFGHLDRFFEDIHRKQESESV